MEPLEQLLLQVGEDVESNPVIPFATLENVHFARLVIVPEAKDLNGRTDPAESGVRGQYGW